MSLTITVTDDQTGDTQTVSIPEGEYFLVCHEPCHLSSTAAYSTGTHLLTIKGVES